MGLGDQPGTNEDDLWELGSRDAIREHLLDIADGKLEAKEQEVGEADWATVERLVLLRTIDSLWVEHLTEIDDMRRGIGLRGYAQQDPLNEFRKEAFRLYEELRGLIRHQVATSIFRVTVTRQPTPGAIPFGAPAGAASGSLATAGAGVAAAATTSSGVATAAGSGAGAIAASGAAGAAGAAGVARIGGGLAPDPMARAMRESTNGGPGQGPGGAKPGFTPSGERIGRNDTCYCGSGLKYKKCHGR